MFSAAILAGGRASRFGGREKSTLTVEGRSIVHRLIDVLLQVASDVTIVGGRPGTPSADGRVRYVADLWPGCGPLGGVHTALVGGAGAATLVVACDMPYVTAPLASHLLALTDRADLVVPRTERGYHPVCAAYTPACIEPIARRLASGRFKMTDLYDEVRVRVVTGEELERFGDPDRLLLNVNTPADYQAIEANQL